MRNQKRELHSSKDGDRHFTEQGRVAEMTIDLVSKARAKLSEHKVNGPEGSLVSEMIKQLPQEKNTRSQDAFKIGLWGDAPSSWRIVKFVFLRNQMQHLRKVKEVIGLLHGRRGCRSGL